MFIEHPLCSQHSPCFLEMTVVVMTLESPVGFEPRLCLFPPWAILNRELATLSLSVPFCVRPVGPLPGVLHGLSRASREASVTWSVGNWTVEQASGLGPGSPRASLYPHVEWPQEWSQGGLGSARSRSRAQLLLPFAL